MSSPLLLASLLASYAAAETISLSIERLIIKDAQLPPSWHNLRVVFITDLHHGPYSSTKRLRQMVHKINKLHPDLILLGGDYLQTHHRSQATMKKDFHELLTILSALHQPPYGIYAVLGNHDYVFSEAYNRRCFATIGIRVLVNEGVTLTNDHHHIRLDGVGDMWYGKPDFASTHADTTPDTFTILLSHQPNFIDTLTPDDHVNFVLAGHTHGAQLRFFHYQPIMPHQIAKWEYTVGLIETPQTRMLVSPGIGNSFPYIRFFSPPKIHLLTFKSAPHWRH